MSVLTNNRELYIDKIHENGYVSAPGFSMSPADIEPLFGSFRYLLDEVYADLGNPKSQDILQAFKVPTPGRPDDGEGYICQRRVGEFNPYDLASEKATEDKDVLHFVPLTPAYSAHYMRERGTCLPEAARQVVRLCTEIHMATREAVRPIFQALGLEGYMLSPEGRAFDDVHLVRVIRYLCTKVNRQDTIYKGADLAQKHFDRSNFAAAVWESSSGLVGAPANNLVGNPNLTLDQVDYFAERTLESPIKHRRNHLKVFAGAGYNHMPDSLQKASGNLPLLLHAVVDDDPTAERFAVVVFMNAVPGTSQIKPEAHEKVFDALRAEVAARQERRGGLVTP